MSKFKHLRISNELAEKCEEKRQELVNAGVEISFQKTVEYVIKLGLPKVPNKLGK